jgi:hypothetical protein
VLDPSKMTARMTSDNVKAAARRYLDPKQYFEPILLPAKYWTERAGAASTLKCGATLSRRCFWRSIIHCRRVP